MYANPLIKQVPKPHDSDCVCASDPHFVHNQTGYDRGCRCPRCGRARALERKLAIARLVEAGTHDKNGRRLPVRKPHGPLRRDTDTWTGRP